MAGYVETLTTFADLEVMGWDKAKILDWLKTQKHIDAWDVYLNDGVCEEYDQHCTNRISGPPELVSEVPIQTTQVVSHFPFDNRGDTTNPSSHTYKESWTVCRDQKIEVVQAAQIKLDSPFNFGAFSSGLSVSLRNKKGDTKSRHHECQYMVDQQVVVQPGQYLELVLQKSTTGKLRRFRVPVSISGCVGTQLEEAHDDHSVLFLNVDELNNGPFMSYIVLDIHDVITKYDILSRTKPNGPLEPFPAIQYEVVIPTEAAGYQEGPVARGISESTAILMRERSRHLEKQLQAAAANVRPLWVPKGGHGILTGGGSYRWIVNWKSIAAASAGSVMLVTAIGKSFPNMAVRCSKNKDGFSFTFEANAVKTRAQEDKDMQTTADSLPADKKPSSINDVPGLQGPHLMFVMEDDNTAEAA